MNKREKAIRLLRRAGALVVLIGVGAALVWTFVTTRENALRELERDKPVKVAPRLSVENGERLIRLDTAAQLHGGIETATLKNAVYQQQIRAYGSVLDLQQLTDLNNRYTSAKAQLEIARAKVTRSKAAFERAQTLYKSSAQTIPLAQLQIAEESFRVEEAGLAAAQSQLQTLSHTAKQTWGSILGDAVVEGTPVAMRLIERKDILIQVTVPPGELIATPPIDALVRLDTGSDVKIVYVSPATKTDPRIQGLSFYYTAPAEVGLLPGMNVLIFLRSANTIEGTAVPSSAIVWLQARSWVYLRAGTESFIRHEAATDFPAADGEYVVRGLGDRVEVVTQGAQVLLSEEFRSQIHIGD